MSGPLQRHILPAAQGTGDGTSFENAGAFSKLNQFVTEAGPGGFVNIGAHQGPFVGVSGVLLKTGGQPDAPVTIRGVDAALNPAKVVLRGSRTPWELSADPEQVTDVRNWARGGDVISLQGNANYLTFDHLRFEHVGDAFSAKSSLTGITVQNFEWSNVRGFWESANGVSLKDFTFKRGVGVGYSKSAFRIRGDTSGLLMEDVSGNSGRQDGDEFAVGVQISETAHDLIFRRVKMSNSHQTTAPTVFANGDGFSAEGGNHGLLFDHCEAYGNTDAGFDCKGVSGSDIFFIGCISGDNKNNYKLWGNKAAGSPNFVLQGITSIEPRKRCGASGSSHIDGANGAVITVMAIPPIPAISSRFVDTRPGGGIYLSENYPCVFHVAADTVESSAKTRTGFFKGSMIDTVVP